MNAGRRACDNCGALLPTSNDIARSLHATLVSWSYLTRESARLLLAEYLGALRGKCRSCIGEQPHAIEAEGDCGRCGAPEPPVAVLVDVRSGVDVPLCAQCALETVRP